MNTAQAERQAARAELDNLPTVATLDKAEVYARIDSLGDVAGALAAKGPETVTRVYRALGLELRYDKEKETVIATVSPRVVNECVRGGT